MTDVTIRELNPELVDDYLRFFADDAFSDNPEWEGCYCYFHHFTGTSEQWQRQTASENREAVEESIRSGGFHGLLAYRGNRPIGWCKATIRAELPAPDRIGPPPNAPFQEVGVVLCFVVSPEHRRQGVARKLLAESCRFLADRGASVIEAYPLRGAETSAEHYHGPLELYRDAGFEIVMEASDGPRTVVRKTL